MHVYFRICSFKNISVSVRKPTHTYLQCILLVWGSLRLTPITYSCSVHVYCNGAKHPINYHYNYLQVHVCLKRETTCIPLTCNGQEADGSSTIIRLLYFHNKSTEDCPTNLLVVTNC